MATTQPPTTANDWKLAAHSPAWQKLSPAQQVFVAAFVALNGNAKEATRRAYPAVRSKPKSVQAMTWGLLKSPRVRAVLDLYEGRGSREQLIELVRAHLEKADPGGVAAQRLLAQLQSLTLGYESETPAPSGPDAAPAPGERQRFAVGDVIEQDGHRFQIQAVQIADVEVDK